MPHQLKRRPAALVAVAALVFAGCSSSAQPGASGFVGEHVAGAASAAAATKGVETDVSRASSAPTARQQLDRLARAAGGARREDVRASEWNVAPEGAEEEDLPRAESQATEGADELAHAMSAAQAYARAPSAAALARYEGALARGRERWNEGISQIWYLAHRSNPPTV
jgi:hypothetical protein